MTRLRQRMVEGMQLRGLAEKTQVAYARAPSNSWLSTMASRRT